MKTIKSFLKKILPRALKDRLWDAYYFYLAFSLKYIEKINAVTLELASACDLHCEVCSVPTLERAKGLMTLEHFRVILDKLPLSVKVMRLNYAGEPLLNRDAFKIIKYAKEKRPDIRIRVSTNGTQLDRFAPQEIIDSRLDELDICLDGITKEIHEGYRRGSDFGRICAAAENLCRFKAQAGAKAPKIIQMTLLSRQNSGMVPQIVEFAKKIGFDELQLRYMAVTGITCSPERLRGMVKFYSELQPEDFNRLAEKYIPAEEYSMYTRKGSRYVVRQELKKCYTFLCPLIYFNGDVGACCHDSEGASVFGNLLKEDFKTVMSRMPAKDIYFKKLPICDSCELSGVGGNWKEIKLR